MDELINCIYEMRSMMFLMIVIIGFLLSWILCVLLSNEKRMKEMITDVRHIRMWAQAKADMDEIVRYEKLDELFRYKVLYPYSREELFEVELDEHCNGKFEVR